MPPLIATVTDLDDIVDARDALRPIAQLKPLQQLVLLLGAEGHAYKVICELTGRTYTWVISRPLCQRRVIAGALSTMTCRRRTRRRSPVSGAVVLCEQIDDGVPIMWSGVVWLAST